MDLNRSELGMFISTTSRKHAMDIGEKYYLGKDCPKKHGGIRFVSNCGCVECLKDHNKKYYNKNIDTRRAASREYAKKDPIGNALRSSNYYKRKIKADGTHTKNDIIRIIAESRNKCFWCGKELEEYHLDHKIPLVRGGTNNPDNLCICCPSCNLSKGYKLPEEWKR